MDNKKFMVIALRDSFLWIILTSLIGLVQLILYLMVSIFVTDKPFDFFIWIKNGALVAFSLALVSSIFFDAHFQKSHKKSMNKKNAYILDECFDGLIYKLLPWLIVFMAACSTMLDIFVDGNDLNKNHLMHTQIAGIIMSYMYAFYFKYCFFYIGVRQDV